MILRVQNYKLLSIYAKKSDQKATFLFIGVL